MNKLIKRYTASIIANAVLILFSLSCIFPIVWMIYSSLKTSPEFNRSIIALPEKLMFDNYVNAIRISHMDTYFVNSLLNALVALVFVIFIAFILGYFLSIFQFRGRKLIYLIILAG
ncbi:MAG: carbohydrate ABC transporter permease, partial [Clostridia bacterium]|nr:carbohydrate ABC transporter permease [Clostridia bacterium]